MDKPMTVVPCPGEFTLLSRIVRLDTGSSYRDIVIHEMTEEEICRLKERAIRYSSMTLLVTMFAMFFFVFVPLATYISKATCP